MKAFALGMLFAGLMLGAATTAHAAGPLEGTWKITAYSEDGKDVPADKTKTMEMTVTGDAYKVTENGKETESGTFKTGKEGDVDTIDFAVLSGEDKGKTQPGIYKIDGTKVQFAYFEEANPARPKELKTAAGQNYLAAEKK